MKRTRTLTLATVAALGLLTSACTDNTSGASDPAGDRRLSVTSTDDGCDLSAQEAPSGTLTFEVQNAGDTVTEFYLLGEDGLRILGEVENIGPGITRNLVVNAPQGDYVTACKPGMKAGASAPTSP